MDFSGRLGAVPLGDVLQWVGQEERNGALVVRRSHKEKRIYIQNGKIVACYSDDPSEYFGKFLFLHDYLAESKVVRALTYCQTKGKRLGRALEELDLLDLEVIQRALRHQIEDSVCDLFLWDRGVFYFEYELLAEEELVPEPINPMRLAMEGARWVDAYRRIRSVFVHDGVVLGPGNQYELEDLEGLQLRVGRAADEGMSIENLHRKIGGSYFRFLEAAFHLTVHEVLDVLDVGAADPQTLSTGIRVTDLLLEQAAEEQIIYTRRHLALPTDVVEEFHPHWIETIPGDEYQRMPDWARILCEGIDGETRLGTLLSEHHKEKNRQVDFLVLQLRKRRLALLPLPAARIWWATSSRDTLAESLTQRLDLGFLKQNHSIRSRDCKKYEELRRQVLP